MASRRTAADVDHPAVAVGRERGVDLLGERGDLAGRGRGEVAAAEAPRGEQPAVFHQHDPLPYQEAPTEKVGDGAGASARPVLSEARQAGRAERAGDCASGSSEKTH